MAIIQISKIQQRSGNIVDLPQLDEAEFGWATDVKRLYIGKTTPNENIEVLTSYSNISFSQINGSFGNLDIDGGNIANGQILSYNGTEWVNKGGNIGGLITLGDVSNVKIDGGAIGYVLETDGSGNLSWSPKSTIIAFIQNATKANPGVVTTTEDNFFVNGSEITITNVTGMTELNGNTYFANVITSNSFSLYSDSALTTPVNTSAYGTFPNTTATATNSTNNRITVTSSAAFTINDPVIFKGTTFGAIVAGQTYYVLTKPTGTTMTISETVGGTVYPVTTDSGSCIVYVPGGRLVSLVSGGGAGGTGVAGGANTMIQFNNTNILDGSSDLTFNFGTTPKILNLNGNANVSNLNATSSIIGSTLTSNVATGTAPLAVTSTTRVANLNVNYANVSDFGVVTTQTTGTYFPTLVSSSATGNRALGANANLSFNVATGNLSTTLLTVTSNASIGNLDVGIITATANISAPFFIGNVQGNISGNLSVNGSNTQVIFNDGGLANATAGFTFNKSSNTVFIGNVLSVTGNANIGNIGTAGSIIAVGNVTGGNIGTAGNVTGNNLSGIIRPTAGNGTAGIIFPADPGGGTGDLATIKYYAVTGEQTVLELTVANDNDDIIRLNASGGTTIGNTLTTTSISSGANTTAGSITGNWTLTAGSRLQATYADLAEYYNADQYYSPGTVLEFGGVNELTIASSNTTRVAGVVSTDPAYAMNAKCPGEFVTPLALQGRVPTKVRGIIHKGDMMISAGDGYATACSSPSLGSIIGKALENFDGEGVIEIVIGRL